MMAKTEKDEEHSLRQAEAQLEGIKEMVAALECDYERLEELKDDLSAKFDDWQEGEGLEDDTPEKQSILDNRKTFKFETWLEIERRDGDDDARELIELTEAAGDCESREDAKQRIQEDPLSIEVRSDWHTPGDKDASTPSEFCILLCTGGPACRIVGDLNQYAEPTRARIEHQDWFTPWRELIVNHADHEALLTYARCFYYGE